MVNANFGSLPGSAPEVAVNTVKMLFAQLMDFLPWTPYAKYRASVPPHQPGRVPVFL